jgi:iduronate 2-sulfatase
MLVIGCIVGVFAGLVSAETVQGRPNVLLIVCDDLNTHVGPSGYESIQTPALDGFAAEGMTFRRAYCQYPVCGPSRASFLNGLYPESTGVVNNDADIRETRPGTVSMPQLFKENGYWTASVGKIFHSTRHEHGEVAWDEFLRMKNDELPVVTKARREFEAAHGSVEDRKNKQAWKALSKEVAGPLSAQTPPGYGPSGLEDEQHMDGKIARQVVDWLEQESYGDKPFFIACGIQKPHVPFLAPQKYFDQYPLERLQYTLDPAELWEGLPKSAASPRYDSFGFELGVENDSLRREYMQAYHACISFIDAQIGLVLAAVKEKGLWEDTIVIFTSDHGYQLGEHFMWGKVTLFEVCDRVPLMVRVPGTTQAGSMSEGLVELVDLYPTLAELNGLKPPDDLQGKSLVPMLKDAAVPGKDTAYTVVSRGPVLGRAIRAGDWRYAEWADGEELYNLAADAEERVNLAGNPEYRPRLEGMRQILAVMRKEAESAAP